MSNPRHKFTRSTWPYLSFLIYLYINTYICISHSWFWLQPVIQHKQASWWRHRNDAGRRNNPWDWYKVRSQLEDQKDKNKWGNNDSLLDIDTNHLMSLLLAAASNVAMNVWEKAVPMLDKITNITVHLISVN